MNSDTDIILSMEHITKTFPGVKALDDVSFELHRGEIHALVGENGAGKSTLMKVLLGIHTPDAGQIYLHGEPVKISSPHLALNSGISMIHQEISLMPTMTAMENIWIGREHLFSNFGIINEKKRSEMTHALLSEYGIEIDPFSYVKDLSVAMCQLLELSRAVSYNAEIIIMDEPTSALTDKEVALLYNICKKLASRGTSIIFISHKLNELFEICDRVTVMRDGQYIATRDVANVTEDELIRMIVGREVKIAFQQRELQTEEIALEVKNICGDGFHDVSFSLRKGEVFGLCGLMGAGRTEVVTSIYGMRKLSAGQVLIGGKPAHIKSTRHAIRFGLGMLTEDRLRLGIFPMLSLRINSTIAYLYRIVNKLGFIRTSAENSDARQVLEKMNVKMSSITQPISSLSGGNQQKVIIGRLLLQNPDVLILDEPTRGIDVGSKSEIYDYIRSLSAQGISVLLVSSELPELLGLCDRIMVMREGKAVAIRDRCETDQEDLIKYAYGY